MTLAIRATVPVITTCKVQLATSLDGHVRRPFALLPYNWIAMKSLLFTFSDTKA